MDSTLTQTMFMRGEVQLGKGLQLLRRKVISIPVLRGEVQHPEDPLWSRPEKEDAEDDSEE